MDIKRMANLTSRWISLYDVNHSFFQIVKNWSSKDEYFKKMILEEEDHSMAEERLRAIEKADSEYKKHCLKKIEQSDALEIAEVKKTMAAVLKESDWTQLVDAPLTTDQKKQWRSYRDYVRHVPKLWKRKQILELKVMSFEEWEKNPPIYKKGS